MRSISSFNDHTKGGVLQTIQSLRKCWKKFKWKVEQQRPLYVLTQPQTRGGLREFEHVMRRREKNTNWITDRITDHGFACKSKLEINKQHNPRQTKNELAL